MANAPEPDKIQETVQPDSKNQSGLIKFLTDPKKLTGTFIGLIVFALVAPVLFTKLSFGVVFDEHTGPIGDTFGIMNPFIAIAAAILTFAAFAAQFIANEKLREDADKDRKENRDEQKKAAIRNQKQQITSRFYEMLQIHRDNVKELEWVQSIHYQKEDTLKKEDDCVQKRGRQIFLYHLIEFDFIYAIIDALYSDLDVKDKIEKAYNIFYKNAPDELFNAAVRERIRNFIQEHNSAISVSLSFYSSSDPLYDLFHNHNAVIRMLEHIFYFKDYFKLQPLFNGHFEELNNYYRHLFLTVKTVAKEKEEYLSYDEKRDLLRILRAQLTNTEQIMLFYNWVSGNGRQWEEDVPDGFHFFTEYRMIHNIMPGRMLPVHLLYKEGKAPKKFIRYITEHLPIYSSIKSFCTKDDPMFEFEERRGNPKFDYDK